MMLAKFRNFRGVASGAALSVGSQVIFVSGQLIISLTIGRLIGPSGLGVYAYSNAIVIPIMLLCSLSLRNIIARDSRYTIRLEDVLRIRKWSVSVALFCLMLFSVIARLDLNVTMTVFALACLKASELTADTLNGAHSRDGRFDLIFTGTLFRIASSICAFLFCMFLSHNVWLALLLAAFGTATATMTFEAFVRRRSSRAYIEAYADAARTSTQQHIGAIIAAAVPITIAAFLASLTSNIPRYFVGSVVGHAQLGLFAAVLQLTAVAGFGFNSAAQSTIPSLAKLAVNEEVQLVRRFVILLVALGAVTGAIMVFCGVIGGSSIIRLLYGADFQPDRVVVNLVFLAGGVSFIFSAVGHCCTALSVQRMQPIVTGAGLAVVVILCIAMVPGWGVVGAAGALATANVVQTLLMGYYLHRRLS